MGKKIVKSETAFIYEGRAQFRYYIIAALSCCATIYGFFLAFFTETEIIFGYLNILVGGIGIFYGIKTLRNRNKAIQDKTVQTRIIFRSVSYSKRNIDEDPSLIFSKKILAKRLRDSMN